MLGLYLSDFKCNLNYICAVNVKFLRNFTTLYLSRLMILGENPQTKHRLISRLLIYLTIADDTTDVFLEKIKAIKNNFRAIKSNESCLSHGQIRHFARCCLAVINNNNWNGIFIYKEYLQIGDLHRIQFWLIILASHGLSHYDRSIVADLILDIFKNAENQQREENRSDAIDEIPF